ncbi:MAG: hypothetical protein CVV24_01700 [Ignavibacteriae bacterium HGW-Ignavibacteriae-3]|nr:MAG: hypothetical protein CVV24_01700 [Ignavibacteriae bacterium HGW-Ignavibacteriae-3]
MEFLSELHPRVVHFPIAFFILYFIFETSGIVLKKDFLQKGSLLILIFGVGTALLSVLTGNQAQAMADLRFPENIEFNRLIEVHREYATVTMWYFSLIMILRIYVVIKKKFVGNLMYVFILFGLIGCILVYLTGIYGGDLVFKHGIGTQILGK